MKLFKLIKEETLDLFYPKECVWCKKEKTWLCQDCYEKIIFACSSICPYCKKITENGKFCKKCRLKTNLTGVISISYFEDGPIKEAVHTLKYDFVKDLGPILGKIMVDNLSGKLPHKAPLIFPVPLHKSRKNWRGFNQSEVLAKSVGEEFGLPVIKDKLLRIKNTRPQIEISGRERRQNIKNAFKYNGQNLKGEVVILVDDVFTTGATLNECAYVLKKAGARQAWGLVLAFDN